MLLVVHLLINCNNKVQTAHNKRQTLRRLTAARAPKKPVRAAPSAGFFSATFLLLLELLAQFLYRNSKNVVCLERYVQCRLVDKIVNLCLLLKKGELNMKKRKHLSIICFLIILIIVFVFIACDKDNNSILCTCEIKEHLGIDETCCGGEDCLCIEQITILNDTEINIRKLKGITVEQMNEAVNKIEEAYMGAATFPAEKIRFKNKVTEIHIINGDTLTLQGTILNIGYSATPINIKYYMIDEIIDVL